MILQSFVIKKIRPINIPYIPKKVAIIKSRNMNFWSKRIAVVGDTIDTTALCTKKMPSIKDIENVSLKMLEGLNECRDAYNKFIKG